MQEEPRHPLFSLLGALVVCSGVGFIGTEGALRGLTGWYQMLAKPGWNPPAWVFAPVWTLLYLLMGVATWMIWKSSSTGRSIALGVFAVQLLLNGAWPWVFFAGHALFASAIEISVLWIVIGLTTLLYFRIKKTAGVLLLPYFAWVLFASALNISIWNLNSAPGATQITTSSDAVPIR